MGEFDLAIGGPVRAKQDAHSARHRRAMRTVCRAAPKYDPLIAMQQEEARRLFTRLGMTLAIPCESSLESVAVMPPILPVETAAGIELLQAERAAPSADLPAASVKEDKHKPSGDFSADHTSPSSNTFDDEELDNVAGYH